MSEAKFSNQIVCLDDIWANALADVNISARIYADKTTQCCNFVSKVLNSLENDFFNLSLNVSKESEYEHMSFSSDILNESIGTDIFPSVSQTDNRFIPMKLQTSLYEFMDSIVTIRVEIYSLLQKYVSNSSDLSSKFQDEIEEIETKALIILTQPSISSFDDIDDHLNNQTELIMKRLVDEAKCCLEQVRNFIESNQSKNNNSYSHTKSSQSINKKNEIRVVKIIQDKIFPNLEESRLLLETNTNLLYPLLSDYNIRKITSKIKRMISCACSQISRHDPQHSLDRLKYILKLLTEDFNELLSEHNSKDVNVHGLVDNIQLPKELCNIYAWQCLYSSTLSQAEYQFSYNIDSALMFASLLAGIFALYPDKLTLFIARIFLTCPILGLFTDSNGPYMVAELLENSDSLTKWRGIARLFAALTLAHPPPSLGVSRSQYLNPMLLWRVIASIINQRFIPCATAEVLHGLLEVGGTALLELYGHQAKRLFKTISLIINSSPLLRQSIPEISLLSMLEISEKKGQFPGGIGFVSVSFWSSA